MPDDTDARHDVSIGRRIQAIRVQRGYTQHGLAQRANVSYSNLTKVEAGHRAASPALTAACARALRVPVTDLTGQPYFDSLKKDQLEELIQPLRHALANPLLPGELEPVRPLRDIRAQIARLDAARLGGEYMPIGAAVPALIDELLLLADTAAAGEAREQAYRALADAYRLGWSFVNKLGFTDLALLALERIQQCAPHAGDPYLQGVVCQGRSDYFLRHGAPEVSLREIRLLERELEDPVRRGDPRAMSMRGTLWLKTAVVSSRSYAPGAANDVAAQIGEARDLAARIVGRPDPYQMCFDLTNVALHAASTQLDLGEAGRSVEMGAQIRFPAGWALNRTAHHYMDMARAHERLGQRDRALEALLEARSAAAVQTRYHPTTRETVMALLRGRGTPSRELRAFARWVGV
ncbi:helix-turn-helix transcriptional regulator [Streptomyces durbertensis]|uniref:Helix-turn-helix transcriptional regulator n=1 Tax=Streptomyces durbertensis TaxID=2448886 RepID=A0ABR6EMJ1_9ACTN|nr:helix-turn-helix transcriptional regulator [Streptomyces durbertensis]MBB1246328.1 helix-turn-helix transcriptional regulator [Streptomyces durbertensis]